MNSIQLMSSRYCYLFNELTSNKNCLLAVKITAVAAVALTSFVLQMSCSLTFGCGMALIATTLTLFSEKVIRPLHPEFTSSNWINTEINKIKLKKFIFNCLVYRTLLVTIVYGCIFSPIQTIAVAISNLHLKTILLVTIIGPLSEEILFRGFLQERIEDSLILINLFIIEIKTEKIKQLVIYTSSLLFGSAHIVGDQVVSVTKKIFVFIVITFIGKFFSDMKNENNQSLLPCIASHMALNTSFTCGLILAKRLLH